MGLIFLLLGMMVGAGTVSAFWGFKLGHESLKGVSQPDINPTKKFTNNQKASAQPKEFTPVSEKKILAQVEAYTKRQSEKSPAKTDKKTEAKSQSNQASEQTKSNYQSSQKANFPLKAEAENITLEVVKASQQDDSVLLEVNLKNGGDKLVKFLYSFLEVKDKQGNSLNAIVEGLPQELPANGEKFAGTIKIPAASGEPNQPISLSLTDYPDRQIKLNISDIPTVE